MFAFYALALVCLVAFWRGNLSITPALRLAWPVIVSLMLLTAWMGVQLILPEPYGTWEPHATLLQMQKTLLYLCIFCLVLLLIRGQSDLELLCWVIVVGGCLQVAIKVVTDSPGTYINRNHFAGYLEMGLALALGLMISRLDGSSAAGWRESVRRWLNTFLSAKVLIRILIITLVVGLILSRSRMGNTAFFGALSVSGLFALYAFRGSSKSITLFFVSILIVDIVLMGALFGLDKLQDRFEQLNVAEDARLYQSEITTEMLKVHGLTGVGAGAYYTAAPTYRDERIGAFYIHAHNDLLQLPLELGVPGSLFLLICLGYSFFFALRTQLVRRNVFMKSMGFASTMGLMSLLIHSSADFNLQLVSNAGTFMLLLAIPFLAMSLSRRGSR